MIIQNIQVKHSNYGIGEGEVYQEKSLTLIKVKFTGKTITFDYQFAFSNKVLVLVNPNQNLVIPIVPQVQTNNVNISTKVNNPFTGRGGFIVTPKPKKKQSGERNYEEKNAKKGIGEGDNNLIELFPIKAWDWNFIWICDKQGTPQVQKIPYIDEAPKRYIKNSEKIIIFKYQLRVLADTFFNSIAYTTQENWYNRLTDKFDNTLIGEIGHYQKLRSFGQAKHYLISLGFAEENIIEEKDNTFIQHLGTVYL